MTNLFWVLVATVKSKFAVPAIVGGRVALGDLGRHFQARKKIDHPPHNCRDLSVNVYAEQHRYWHSTHRPCIPTSVLTERGIS